MADIGLFYGSTGGRTKEVAQKIQKAFGADRVELVNVANADPEQAEGYKYLIFGTSTYGLGSLQEDWADFIWDLDDADLSGKKVALFGLGDQKDYPDSFVDAMKEIKDKVEERGGEVVGSWPTDGYEFKKSTAMEGDDFIGLAIDEDRQSDLTDERVAKWVDQIQSEFS